MSCRSSPSIAASSPACGVRTAARPGSRCWSASASTTTGTPSARAACSSSPAASPPPEPTTQACTRPAPTTSGWCALTSSATASSPTYRTIPASPHSRAGHAEQGGAGVLRAAGADADHASRVLLRSRRRPRQQRRDVLGLERLQPRFGQLEPDVDEVHRAAGLGRRVHQVTDLVGAERDGQCRVDVRRPAPRRCRRRRRWGCPRRRPVRRAAASARWRRSPGARRGRRSRRCRRRPPRAVRVGSVTTRPPARSSAALPSGGPGR